MSQDKAQQAGAPSQSLMLKLAIAAIIRRIEFDAESINVLVKNIPEGAVRAGLVAFDADIAAAVEKMKQVKT